MPEARTQGMIDAVEQGIKDAQGSEPSAAQRALQKREARLKTMDTRVARANLQLSSTRGSKTERQALRDLVSSWKAERKTTVSEIKALKQSTPK